MISIVHQLQGREQQLEKNHHGETLYIYIYIYIIIFFLSKISQSFIMIIFIFNYHLQMALDLLSFFHL